MNKFKLLAVLFLLPVMAFSQQQKEERIIINENEHAYVNFPSSETKTQRNVRFVLPQGYLETRASYPVVYVLGETEHKKTVVSKDAIFVFITPAEKELDTAAFTRFLLRDVLIYTDLNFRTKAEPRYRMLAGRNFNAQFVANIYQNQTQIENLALIDVKFFDDLKTFAPQGRILLSGAKKEINRFVFNEKFKFGGNLLYSFKEDVSLSSIPTDMVFSPEGYAKDFKLFLSTDTNGVPRGFKEGVDMTATLVYKNGFEANYLPLQSDLTIKPSSALIWNEQPQQFFITKSAAESAKKRNVKVKLSLLGQTSDLKIKLF
ncbi:hypothetical protein Emin_0317 [Elusimicrobium minutum Pei191]|uniref:Uncharacterized protein n=1 Tax=Elusimicrobium minutum (strain Pei191) TaxID=445932 RepID=B2KBX2_ELUMP|nr:hypothetical protein [Elusimicrobium minutum]ACC97876.1 hypothetical protein Emin_0317 [Elusimicrobium minutum Pei191]